MRVIGPKGDWRNKYFDPKNLKESVEHAERLIKILPKDMTLPELALRFILSNSDVSTTIPGVRKIKNVDANVKSAEKGKLSLELIRQVRSHRWDRKPTPSAG